MRLLANIPVYPVWLRDHGAEAGWASGQARARKRKERIGAYGALTRGRGGTHGAVVEPHDASGWERGLGDTEAIEVALAPSKGGQGARGDTGAVVEIARVFASRAGSRTERAFARSKVTMRKANGAVEDR